MTEPRGTYKVRHDGSDEQARDIRARAWQFVFECYEKTAAEKTSVIEDQQSTSKGRGGQCNSQ